MEANLSTSMGAIDSDMSDSKKKKKKERRWRGKRGRLIYRIASKHMEWYIENGRTDTLWSNNEAYIYCNSSLLIRMESKSTSFLHGIHDMLVCL